MYGVGLHRGLEWYGVTHGRAICRDPKTIRPRLIDQIAAVLAALDVVVGLEILHDNELLCREVPHIALPCRGGFDVIHLINPPVVSAAQFE